MNVKGIYMIYYLCHLLKEAVKHVAQRIRYVQDFLGLQISLENTSYYLHSPTSTMNEVEFFKCYCTRSGL